MRWASMLLCASGAAWAQDSVQAQATFGAVESPVTLPAGASSAYGFAGVPEVGAGYRQGIGPVEVEGRARFNYFDLSVAAEGLVKLNVLHAGPWDLAPFLGVGLVGDSGSQYIDTANFSYFGLRLLPGALGAYRLADTVRLVAELDVPIDLALTSPGGSRVGTLAGGGAELYIGNGVSGLLLAEGGVEAVAAPARPTAWRFAYEVRLGIGWRMF